MRITWEAACSTDAATLQRNEAHSQGLGLPRLGAYGCQPRLAVVGSGEIDWDALKRFDGEVWAINRAYHWCQERGIDATFYAVDASPIIAEWARGAMRAVLATRCDPATFDAVKGAYVELCEVPANGGPSAATCAVMIAIERGHREIHWFGCGSHVADVDAPRFRQSLLKVRANGCEFLTDPGLVMQAEYLADVIRAAPHLFHDRSGGLLAALVADPDLVTVAATANVHQAIKTQAIA